MSPRGHSSLSSCSRQNLTSFTQLLLGHLIDAEIGHYFPELQLVLSDTQRPFGHKNPLGQLGTTLQSCIDDLQVPSKHFIGKSALQVI